MVAPDRSGKWLSRGIRTPIAISDGTSRHGASLSGPGADRGIRGVPCRAAASLGDMTGRVDALTVCHWVCTLAEDSARVLDAPMALMAGVRAMPAARVSGRRVGVSVPELAAMIGQVSWKRPSLTRPVTAGQPVNVLGTKRSQDRECHAVAQLPEWVTPIPAPYLRPEDVTLSVGAQPLVGPGNAGQRPGPRPHPCRRRGRHPAGCHPGQRPAAAAGRRGASSRRVKGPGTRGTLRNLCLQTITRRSPSGRLGALSASGRPLRPA